MDFSSIYKIIDSYGLLGFIIISILLISVTCLPIVLNKVLSKHNSQLSNNIASSMEKFASNLTEGMTSQNDILIKTISESQTKMLDNQNELFKYLIKNRKEDEDMMQSHKVNMNTREANTFQINNILEESIDIYKCDRMCIIEFHNGAENLNGLPFKSYDIQYEAIRRGVKSISNKCKDLPYSIICPIVDLIYKETKDLSTPNNVILYRDGIENLKSSVLRGYLLEELNLNILVAVGLWNKSNTLVGILMLEYTDTNVLPEILNTNSINGISQWIEKLLAKDVLVE